MSAVATEPVATPLPTPAPAPSPRPTAWDRPPFDVVLLCTVLALVTLSVVMVYSSSALMNRSDSLFFMKRQVVYVVLGLIAMTTTMRVDYRRLERWAYPLLFLTGFLVILTFVPGIGLRAGNAQRFHELDRLAGILLAGKARQGLVMRGLAGRQIADRLIGDLEIAVAHRLGQVGKTALGLVHHVGEGA